MAEIPAIDSALKATLDRLTALSSSIIADSTGGKGVIAPGLMRISGKGTVAGRAVTAECGFGALQAVFATLEQAVPGSFLCITAEPGVSAYMGDLLATDIVGRGLTGVIVDGLIRDREVISQLPVSFYAQGVYPWAARRQAPGKSMVPVEVGGVTIKPGDWIVGDDDGLVVIPDAELEAVIATSEENARLEEQIMALIAGGAKVTDAVRQVLAAAGRPAVR